MIKNTGHGKLLKSPAVLHVERNPLQLALLQSFLDLRIAVDLGYQGKERHDPSLWAEFLKMSVVSLGSGCRFQLGLHRILLGKQPNVGHMV